MQRLFSDPNLEHNFNLKEVNMQGTYGKSYIMGQMSKQGVMNEANEGSLYREGLDQMLLGSTDLNSYNSNPKTSWKQTWVKQVTLWDRHKNRAVKAQKANE